MEGNNGAVIRLALGPEVLARTRFAYSPLWEAVLSYRALTNPSRHFLHWPWVSGARRALSGMDLSALSRICDPAQPVPSVLLPVPAISSPDPSTEIDRLRSVAIPLPPTDHSDLADVLHEYWRVVLAPHWPRMRALLEDEVMHQARTLAFEGPEAVLRGLHPRIRLRNHVLEIRAWRVEEQRLDGTGLILVPHIFGWPEVLVVQGEDRIAVAYPARGIATLWAGAEGISDEALGVMLGRRRAAVLRTLRAPRATVELAQELAMAPSAVSYHLTELRRARLVESGREGRRVLYRLSRSGEVLLALGDDPANNASPGGASRKDVEWLPRRA
jgi:DNA-binding transcriptional ArsR family regulator